MKNDPFHPLRLLSVLLLYPDETFLSRLKEIEAGIEEMPSMEMKHHMGDFLSYLRAHAPIDLQESYTAAFDMSPSTTLNLTYHQHGDSEERAAVLARLQQVYRDAGYERTSTELPDYLPMMLEFLSLCPDNGQDDLIWECLGGLEGFTDRLGQTAPPYATLLQPLVRMAADRLESRKD